MFFVPFDENSLDIPHVLFYWPMLVCKRPERPVAPVRVILPLDEIPALARQPSPKLLHPEHIELCTFLGLSKI